MAGHSKWANIKHRKAAQDAKRGKIWTRLIRELTVAARSGGDDPADNPRLRLAVDKASAANIPKDTIDRAITRGSGSGDADSVQQLSYEGYAPGGVAILVEAITDNRNRTVSGVRHAFSKYDGSLGTSGSVGYLFSRRGVFVFAPGADEDAVLEAAIEAGAEDVQRQQDGSIEVSTSTEAFAAVRGALIQAGLIADSEELTMVPSVYAEVSGEDSARALRLIEALDDLDDVQEVHTNGVFHQPEDE